MASQLELRLERQIEGESDLALQAISKAKLACYLARIGDFDRAENIKIELRKKFSDGNFVRISILLMLLDGLLLYYKELSPKARDRIFRANILSSTFHVHDLTALTSSWLAHIDFNRCHFSEMATEVRKCQEFIGYDDGTAGCRISLVLGDAFLYSRQRQHSQIWYERARVAATKLGDQAAIGALTYNRAALNVQNLRLKNIEREVDRDEISTVSAELQTAFNYQALANLKSLDHLLRAASIGINLVKENYSEAAAEALDLIRSEAVPIGTGEYLIVLSDLAKCRVMLGELDAANIALKQIVENEVLKLDEDDKIIILENLAFVMAATGDMQLQDKYRKMKMDSHARFSASLEDLTRVIENFRDPAFMS